MNAHDADVVIVPGYTPLGALSPIRLHPQARGRLVRGLAAARVFGVDVILVSGGAVHPEGTPYVEADEMKAWLVGEGWAPEHVWRDPWARHTHTNLRNAGRLMLERGRRLALVCTDLLQSFYIASPDRSGLRSRSVADLGYYPGRVARVSPRITLFEPTQDVFRRGPDPLDP